MIVARIDGNWGAGDAHLTMLEMLCALDPEDQTIKALYERLKDRSNKYSGKPDWKAESVYRDEGKEEAGKYAEEIMQRYGKEFFDLFWDEVWDWF
jgi:hypothetical protein